MTLKNNSVLCFFGHHKCGTQWIQGILREVCKDVGYKYNFAYEPRMFNHDLREFLEKQKTDIFAYTNANYDYVKGLDNFKGFHIIRDPRDIVVSGYFSHLYSHPTEQSTRIREERERLKEVSKDEGLLLEMDFNYNVFKEMYEWNYSLENVLEMKMEDLIANPYRGFVDIFRFLGLVSQSRPTFKERWSHLLNMTTSRVQEVIGTKPLIYLPLATIPYERILGIVYENDFSKKTMGRKLGEENTKSHYRKGVAGDWKNHFNEQHIAVFKEKYNEILIKLGYEQDAQW
ncbi:MAG TPA: sulfotransferase [Cyanobacteria bacterium UBA12227]|nr:sulfotransferase [Cyanobacteria bacterium UBA12227]HAX86536.1 sulfotransferase [Cyanobacteria bacterium UBA11370]HBY80395.1 sulfotransferase [Cyanobacteria bacterium UBA11148]